MKFLNAHAAPADVLGRNRFWTRFQVNLAFLASGIVAALSACTAHAQTLPQPPSLQTVSPTGVELNGLTYTATVKDLVIGPLALERAYFASGMGHNYMGTWSHNYDSYVTAGVWQNDAQTHVIAGFETYKFYGIVGVNSTTPKYDETGLTIQEVGSQYVFTQRDGTIYRFSAHDPNFQVRMLDSISRPDGSIETISYVSSKPKLITSNKGFAIVLDYSGSKVVAACGFNLATAYVTTSTTCAGATLKVSYGYTGNLLTSFTDVMGNTATYGYTNGLSCVTNPGSSVCKVTNTYTPGRPEIASQTMADGTVWQFSCSCGVDPDDVYNYGSYTDPVGRQVLVTLYGEHRQPQDYWDDTKHYYLAMAGRYPGGATLPEGNAILRSYNARYAPAGASVKAKPGSGQPDLNEVMAFPASCTNPVTCNRPTTITDPKGNVTTFTYDPTHGGVLTESRPAGADGVQPVIRNTYGQRYAWISNGAGGYSPTASPLWLLTETRSCNTSATVGNACAAGAADEIVTTYDYGPNSGPNLLYLRGKVVTSNGVSLRTCYGYDNWGNKIYETSPRAGLATCS
jgi:hypothetical protein